MADPMLPVVYRQEEDDEQVKSTPVSKGALLGAGLFTLGKAFQLRNGVPKKGPSAVAQLLASAAFGALAGMTGGHWYMTKHSSQGIKNMENNLVKEAAAVAAVTLPDPERWKNIIPPVGKTIPSYNIIQSTDSGIVADAKKAVQVSGVGLIDAPKNSTVISPPNSAEIHITDVATPNVEVEDVQDYYDPLDTYDGTFETATTASEGTNSVLDAISDHPIISAVCGTALGAGLAYGGYKALNYYKNRGATPQLNKVSAVQKENYIPIMHSYLYNKHGLNKVALDFDSVVDTAATKGQEALDHIVEKATPIGDTIVNRGHNLIDETLDNGQSLVNKGFDAMGRTGNLFYKSLANKLDSIGGKATEEAINKTVDTAVNNVVDKAGESASNVMGGGLRSFGHDAAKFIGDSAKAFDKGVTAAGAGINSAFDNPLLSNRVMGYTALGGLGVAGKGAFNYLSGDDRRKHASIDLQSACTLAKAACSVDNSSMSDVNKIASVYGKENNLNMNKDLYNACELAKTASIGDGIVDVVDPVVRGLRNVGIVAGEYGTKAYNTIADAVNPSIVPTAVSNAAAGAASTAAQAINNAGGWNLVGQPLTNLAGGVDPVYLGAAVTVPTVAATAYGLNKARKALPAVVKTSAVDFDADILQPAVTGLRNLGITGIEYANKLYNNAADVVNPSIMTGAKNWVGGVGADLARAYNNMGVGNLVAKAYDVDPALIGAGMVAAPAVALGATGLYAANKVKNSLPALPAVVKTSSFDFADDIVDPVVTGLRNIGITANEYGQKLYNNITGSGSNTLTGIGASVARGLNNIGLGDRLTLHGVDPALIGAGVVAVPTAAIGGGAYALSKKAADLTVPMATNPKPAPENGTMPVQGMTTGSVYEDPSKAAELAKAQQIAAAAAAAAMQGMPQQAAAQKTAAALAVPVPAVVPQAVAAVNHNVVVPAASIVRANPGYAGIAAGVPLGIGGAVLYNNKENIMDAAAAEYANALAAAKGLGAAAQAAYDAGVEKLSYAIELYDDVVDYFNGDCTVKTASVVTPEIAQEAAQTAQYLYADAINKIAAAAVDYQRAVKLAADLQPAVTELQQTGVGSPAVGPDGRVVAVRNGAAQNIAAQVAAQAQAAACAQQGAC